VRKIELVLNRARLQLLTLEHVQDLYSIVENNPPLWTYMPRKMVCEGDMKEMVEETVMKYKQGAVLPFVVIDQQTNKIVGSTRLYDISMEYKTLELGYTFYDQSVQRTSVNTECKYLLLKHAFESLQMIRVQIKTDLRNKKAQKAIERLGAVKEGVLRNERMLYTGQPRNACVYSITSEEWGSVKKHLELLLSDRR
jgi:RimJ/RimL family protein N-acetyltransferase